MGLREIDPGGGAVDGADKADINANFRELFSMWSEFTAISSTGAGLAKTIIHFN